MTKTPRKRKGLQKEFWAIRKDGLYVCFFGRGLSGCLHWNTRGKLWKSEKMVKKFMELVRMCTKTSEDDTLDPFEGAEVVKYQLVEVAQAPCKNYGE